METNQRKYAGGSELEEGCKSVGQQGCNWTQFDMLEKLKLGK